MELQLISVLLGPNRSRPSGVNETKVFPIRLGGKSEGEEEDREEKGAWFFGSARQHDPTTSRNVEKKVSPTYKYEYFVF